MNSSASLIAKLRAADVSLYRAGEQLIVEASPGVITFEIRAELARSKMEVLAALDQELAVPVSRDYEVTEALGEIAGLLATAYHRYSSIQRVGADQRWNLVDGELANSTGPSVHGGVS